MNRFEIYFRNRTNRLVNEGRDKNKSRMVPGFLAAESMEVLFTGWGILKEEQTWEWGSSRS